MIRSALFVSAIFSMFVTPALAQDLQLSYDPLAGVIRGELPAGTVRDGPVQLDVDVAPFDRDALRGVLEPQLTLRFDGPFAVELPRNLLDGATHQITVVATQAPTRPQATTRAPQGARLVGIEVLQAALSALKPFAFAVRRFYSFPLRVADARIHAVTRTFGGRVIKITYRGATKVVLLELPTPARARQFKARVAKKLDGKPLPDEGGLGLVPPFQAPAAPVGE